MSINLSLSSICRPCWKMTEISRKDYNFVAIMEGRMNSNVWIPSFSLTHHIRHEHGTENKLVVLANECRLLWGTCSYQAAPEFSDKNNTQDSFFPPSGLLSFFQHEMPECSWLHVLWYLLWAYTCTRNDQQWTINSGSTSKQFSSLQNIKWFHSQHSNKLSVPFCGAKAAEIS